MTPRRLTRTKWWTLAPALAALALATAGSAPGAGAPGDSPAPAPLLPGPATTNKPPPLPTFTKPAPVQFFRQLLAVTGAQREELLGRYPESVRERLAAKLKEYSDLPAEERELRLQTTELRWYLLQLMRVPAANRTAQLATLPAAQQRLVADRLQQWDQLPVAEQQEVLEYESTLQYFVPQAGVTAPHAAAPPPGAQTEEIARKLAAWNALPPARREQLNERFERFFQLTDTERNRTLQAWSGPERALMEKSLQSFAQLPAEQREQCVRAFSRFASLSSAERGEFLRNAERWQEMPAGERQAWRNLVRRLPHPPPAPPPPLPLLPARPPVRFATNQPPVAGPTNGD